MNRAFFRIYQNKKERFPLDMCSYLLCGYCMMTQDLELAYPGRPRGGTPYETNLCSWMLPRFWCKCNNFLVCCTLCLMPIPCYCVVQAWSVYHLNNSDSSLVACCRPALCCCFGFAINRDKISEVRKHHRYFCYDCLLHSCPLSCFCMIMQEFLEGRDKDLKKESVQ